MIREIDTEPWDGEPDEDASSGLPGWMKWESCATVLTPTPIPAPKRIKSNDT
jgi:hypothetical protein